MYKHILVTVAYDEGHDAGPSLQVAQTLADVGAQISLIHVMDPPPSFALSYMPEGWRDEMRNAIEADLTTLAGDWDNTAVHVTEGDAAQQILDIAQLQAVDCIVIASHRPGTQGLFLGSTATKVVSRAQCAVHVVRRA
ncbi:universal stress protein [Roseinatronobacter sp. S2]|uniref:universal stress protein n=1 Tax=Roseinatronobacter sp. S2 TaxID=3035471 RepID=UPI00241061A2|nr:universal stress protein [Roseinatronobacter sp. S2]WFE73708.1 universal stress protein [Roseinatronobacter sp. S2]